MCLDGSGLGVKLIRDESSRPRTGVGYTEESASTPTRRCITDRPTRNTVLLVLGTFYFLVRLNKDRVKPRHFTGITFLVASTRESPHMFETEADQRQCRPLGTCPPIGRVVSSDRPRAGLHRPIYSGQNVDLDLGMTVSHVGVSYMTPHSR